MEFNKFNTKFNNKANLSVSVRYMRLLHSKNGKASKSYLKIYGGKKLAPNGSRSGNVAPQMAAHQKVGLPHLFLTVCLFAELKRSGRVFIR